MAGKPDVLDKTLVYLAKRDGIDKVVKTIQYTCKIVGWHARTNLGYHDFADRLQRLEKSAGTSRKAFRLGRFLAGLNDIRHSNLPPGIFVLNVVANAGDVVYFFFDHFIWLSRVGFLHPKLEPTFEYISAFGEALGYIAAITADFILIQRNLREEQLILQQLDDKTIDSEIAQCRLQTLGNSRFLRSLSIIANLGDLIIAWNDVRPGGWCGHPVALSVGGFMSAFSGAIKNWPSN